MNLARRMFPAGFGGIFMEAKDRYLAVAVLAFGLIYTMSAWRLPRAPVGNSFGPVYFPLGLGVLVSVIGLLMLVQSLRTHQETARKPSKLSVRMWIAVLFCVGYALTFDRFGFMISTFVFLTSFLLLLNGLKKWPLCLTIALLYT
ncbi:MAG: Putative tricarboxylate transport protein TctB, partial [Thermotoga sp. 50_1627]